MSEPDNLANSFGPPARSLSTMLPPRRRRGARDLPPDETTAAPPDDPRTATDTSAAAPPSGPGAPGRNAPQPEPEPEPDPDPDPRGSGAGRVGTATPTRSRGGGTARRAPARNGPRPTAVPDPDDHTSYQIVVYVHPSVKSIALTRRREQKVSNAEIAFDAIDAVQHRLDGLIKTRRLQSRPESSLFPGRVRRGRVGGGGAAGDPTEARRVLWGFRATGQELAVIDRLMERSGAESRSELVATALEEVLLPSPTRR